MEVASERPAAPEICALCDRLAVRTNCTAPLCATCAGELRIGVRGPSAAAGRNDRCPCGSGDKFKRCCARKGPRCA